MKLRSISLKMVLLGLVTVVLGVADGEMALAGIPDSGIQCVACHEQGGGGDKPLKEEYQGSEGCVNCHSSSTSSTTYDIDVGMGETVTVPVVNYLSASAPTEYLAGGNFWWVNEGLGGDDTKGHNVLGISNTDPNYSTGAPGNMYQCSNSCHMNMAVQQTVIPEYGSGCEGCHLDVKHHAPNAAPGEVTVAANGYYRFLAGHMSGTGLGVEGIEDNDWEATSNAADHNEYLGWVGVHDSAAGFYNLGNTMTAFCCGCHGNYHIQDSSYARHPADLKISIAGAFESGYDPDVPVARTSLGLGGGVTASVTLGTDMVMCLSCHRPHGSPYPKMLRWDMNNVGQPGEDKGCSVCHTNIKK